MTNRQSEAASGIFAKLQPYLLSAVFITGTASWLIHDHYPPWMSFYNEFAAFTGLWLLLLYVIYTRQQRVSLPLWPATIFIVALIPLTQYTFDLIYFSGDAVMASIYICGLAIAGYTGYILSDLNKHGFTLALSCIFIFASLISTALALTQWLELELLDLWIYGASPKRPGANFGQPNHLATALYLGAVSAFYLKFIGKISTPTLLLSITVYFFTISLTQSRMAWVSLAFLTIWILLKSRTLPVTNKKPVCVALVLAVTLVISQVSFWPSEINLQLSESASTGQRSDLVDPGSRFSMWEGLAQAVWERPMQGYGWNQVSIAHALFAKDYPLPELVSHSHNIFLDLLIWNGIPIGMTIILAMVLWFISRAWKAKTPESWFALLAIGLVGTHSLLEYPLEYAYFLLPVGLLAGLAEHDHGTCKTISLPKKYLWIVLAAFGTTLITVGYEYRIVENDYRLARFESRNIGAKRTVSDTPKLLLLTQLRADLRFMRTEITDHMPPDTLENMQKTAYRYPFISNIFRYSLAMAVNKRYDAAGIEILRLKDLYGETAYELAMENMQILANSRFPKLHDFILHLNRMQKPNLASHH